MPMSSGGLQVAMQNAVTMLEEPALALQRLGEAIANYIKENALVSFAWTGMNTLPPQDAEMQTPEGKIVELEIRLTPSCAESPLPALNYLAQEITNWVRKGKYNIVAAGYMTNAEAMIDVPDLLLRINATDERNSAFEQLASQIYNWIIAYRPGTPCGGTHGTYGGIGSVTAIS